MGVVIDSEEGVEAYARALQENEPYDLITMDILMPDADGQQALREIRSIEKERVFSPYRRVKVIMISGLDDSEELHDAFFLGEAVGYFVKPINHSALPREIEKLGVPLPSASKHCQEKQRIHALGASGDVRIARKQTAHRHPLSEKFHGKYCLGSPAGRSGGNAAGAGQKPRFWMKHSSRGREMPACETA